MVSVLWLPSTLVAEFMPSMVSVLWLPSTLVAEFMPSVKRGAPDARDDKSLLR